MNLTHVRSLTQKGFTLVELMVSLAIGLVIILALITMLVNVNRNNTEMSKANRQIENGRYALQLLEADVQHAGYWGGFVPAFDDLTTTGVPADVPTAVPDPCASYSPTPWTAAYKTNLLGIPVQPYEIAYPVPTPTLGVCASIVSSPYVIPVSGMSTDVLFVRHADTCAAGAGNCPALTTGDLGFQVQLCGTTTPPTQYVMATAGLTLQNRNCSTTAEIRKFVSNLYYIRSYAVTAGDGIPTLMRSQFGLSGTTLGHKAAEAMIEGIEAFRVELGVDNLSDSGGAVNFAQSIAWADPTNLKSPTNRGDGIPDGGFVHCPSTGCTAAQLMNTTVVKIYVLSRNDTVTLGYSDTKTYNLGSLTVGPFNDGYKRHLFTQTVRLNNVASRRETPT